MSLLDYDGLDYHTGKFKTWVKKLLEGKSNTGHKHTKSDITDFPNLGTASVKDVASTGNASTTQVVMGNDSRLSNARPASDVSAWAKASSKPSYSWDEITSKPNTFTPSDHTHSYLPLSGGTVEGDLEVKYNSGGSGGTLTAQNLRVKGDYTSGFSRNDMTSTTTLAINGNCYIYNSMGGHTSLKTDLVGSATNTVYLPSTDGTLTTSAGKSATYTSSLSSGSDTLFTQAGAYAMYSELNSNLGKFEESSDSTKTVPNNTNTIVSSKTLHAGTYILKGVVRFPNATSDYLRSIGFDTRSSLQYPICSYKNAESIISKDTITLNVINIIQIAADTTYNLYAYQNSGLSQDTSYNIISVIRIK